MSAPLFVCPKPESAARRITVAVVSPLPVRAAGAGGAGRADVEPQNDVRTADVVLAAAPTVTSEFLAELARQWQVADNPEQAVVLATDTLREGQLPAVFAAGVVGVVHLRDLNRSTARSVVHAVASGRALLPHRVTRRLIEEQRILQRDMLAPDELQVSSSPCDPCGA